MRKGFAIIEVMLVIWIGTLLGYGVYKGVVEIKYSPPACVERR